jgi:hypothetical protein
MERKIKNLVTGYKTQDGAGVSLVRVLGNGTVDEYDPILLLDSCDSINPDDYIAGFPMHPHRGIETISYVYQGKITHRDSLGNEDTIGEGEVVSWGGPIVMNTREELDKAFDDLRRGTFLKEEIRY